MMLQGVFCLNQILMERVKSAVPNCSLCHLEFDSYYHLPRVVPKCGHTFCEKCATKKVHLRANRKIFICPDCESEVVIRKTIAEELPVNSGILQMVRNLRKSQAEKRAQSQGQLCKLHNQKLQLVCNTCKCIRICSHCGLFGDHYQHDISKEMHATKEDLNDVKKSFQLIAETAKELLLPNAKAKSALVKSLQEVVNKHFKLYYEQLEKREYELVLECEEAPLEETIEDMLEKLVTEYDYLRNMFELSAQEPMTESKTRDFISKCDQFHKSVEKLQAQSKESVNTTVSEARRRLAIQYLFKIQQLPFTIKRLLQKEELGSSKVSSKTKSKEKKPTNPSSNSPDSPSIIDGVKTNPNGKVPPSSSNRSFKKSTFAVDQRQTKRESKRLSKRDSKCTDILIIDNNTGKLKNEIRKASKEGAPEIGNSRISNIETVKPTNGSKDTSISKSHFQGQMQDTKIEDFFTRTCDGKFNVPPTRDSRKSQSSPIAEKELRYTTPIRELPYTLNNIFTDIKEQCKRQCQSQTLQLISMQLSDTLLPYLLEYLHKSQSRHQSLKLVRNNLTDEGMRVLLGYLVSDDCTQELNLTNNQLTGRSLEWIAIFAKRNSILKTFYLTNNKVSARELKEWREEFAKHDLKVVV